jgi:bacillopeptidase F (M6 metalloprotease family)
MSTWDTEDNGAIAAHEFGHMLGNPDEYTDRVCPNRNPVNTGTIMDDNTANIPDRMMKRFADNIGSTVVNIQ